MLVTIAGLALAALVATFTGSSFTSSFRVTVLLVGGLFLLLAGTGSSPAMDRALGQRTRTRVGPLLGKPDESHAAPQASVSAVLVLAALALIAIGVLVNR
jgi:hypothetical protein